MDSSPVTIIFGPPGTGKTTKLLELMEHAFSEGIKPREIGFLTFTRKAATEAKERAMVKFPAIMAEDFEHFRTLHSLAFRGLNIRRGGVMDRKDYQKVGDLCGLEVTGKQISMDDDFLWMGSAKGDKCIFLETLARVKCISLKQLYNEEGRDEPSFEELDLFTAKLAAYKRSQSMSDFTDLLEKFIDEGNLPRFKVLFIDEAQDLSRLQWKLVKKLLVRSDRSFIAGDDDQAIFTWAGADIDGFLAIEGRRVTLDQSYRVPNEVHKIADYLQKRIVGGVPKLWKPRDEKGAVLWHNEYPVDLMSSGSWLLLARNNYQLRAMEAICEDHGFPFEGPTSVLRKGGLAGIVAWERLRAGKTVPASEAANVYSLMTLGKGYASQGRVKLQRMSNRDTVNMEQLKHSFGLLTDAIWHVGLDKLDDRQVSYYIKTLKRGEKITGKPRIKVSTIHGAKGGEADSVLILTDWSRNNENSFMQNPSNEFRVWYVGVTRAKRALHIMEPNTDMHFRELAEPHYLV